jgi:putative copper export protein
MTGWDAIRWIHLIAMAFFVGGQLMLAAVVVPVARGTDAMRAAARRFGYGTLIAIGVLLVTGAAMASHYDQWSDGTLHAKLGLVAVVGLLIGAHLRRPANHALDGLIFLGSLVIVYLGVTLAHG